MLLSPSKVFACLTVVSIALGSTPTSSVLQSPPKKSIRAVDFSYVSLISIHFTTPSSGWNLRIKSNNSSTPDEATNKFR